MAKLAPNKKNIVGQGVEDTVDNYEQVSTEGKKKKVPEEYPRGLKKIASYSGVTRTMRFRDKNGKFDEIVNIYVYPDGIVTDYDDKVVDKYLGENAISKHNVREKDKTLWGEKWAQAGHAEKSAARHKKPSKPVKRMGIPKHVVSHKRK